MSFLGSCSKTEYEPLIKPLKIERIIESETVGVKLSEIKDLDRYSTVVSIVSSPDDVPVGIDASDIDFSRYSLVIARYMELGDIVSCEYTWNYNEWEDRYILSVAMRKIRGSEYEGDEIEHATCLSCAIVVRRVPSDIRISLASSIRVVDRK